MSGSKLFLIGALVSIIITVGSYKTHQGPVETLMLLLLQWVFTFCLELRFAKSASDEILSELARLRTDPSLLTDIRQIASQAIIARSLKSPVINKHLDRVLELARNKTAELANGTLKVDLGPGGRHLPDLVDLCKHKYQGVSLVDLTEYWQGPMGRESLKKCKIAVDRKKIVERIFIERRAQSSLLAGIVREHKAAGVRCFIVFFDQVDAGLRQDFAIIDGDKAAVRLTIDSDRVWTEANYCVNKEGSAGCAQLQELVETWRSLMHNAIPADDFLRSFPLPSELATKPS
jgi:hypothetical protein